MKKILLIFFITLILILSSGFIQALPLRLTGNNIKMNNTSVFSVEININNYNIIESKDEQKIVIDGFGRLNKVGEPYLPSKILSIAIPPDADFIDIEYELKEIQKINGNYQIIPIPLPHLENNNLDIEKQLIEEYEKNINTIFKNNDFYPNVNVKFLRNSKYREYNLVDIQVTPLSYNPILKELEFYPHISIDIKYSYDSNSNKEIYRFNKEAEKIANEIIYNYNEAQKWYLKSNQINDESYEYVIITLESLTSAINSLVDWEIIKGKNVKVVTIDWINSNYNGIDLAQKIRYFLMDKYSSDQWNIQDVCIIGHWDDIPMRKTSQSIGINDEPVQTDYYYAELSLKDNESWDNDEDGRYGENSDPIDFYNEINVGRIPWSDFETVQHICEKSVAFEQNTNPSFKNNILLLASIVDGQTDGATFMEYCVNETIHPWMNHWMKTRMYERDSNYFYDYILNHRNVVDIWSEGKFAFVSWHAHGSPEGSYVGNQAFIHMDDCTSLNDQYPAIISAASCSNSDTDYLNIGQAMMKQGAVGFAGANKAAYYSSGWAHPNDGSDQSFKYFFKTAITSGEYTQGQAFQYSLREMYVNGLWFNQKYESFCHGSLWGQPDLGINNYFNNTNPEKPQTPNGPTNGRINVEQEYTTSTVDPEGDDVYYCWDWDDGNVEWFGPINSGFETTSSHTWNEEGNYNIRVKAKDVYGGESNWSDPLPISVPKYKFGFINNIFKLLEYLNNLIFTIN
jgi:hypothetical protein